MGSLKRTMLGLGGLVSGAGTIVLSGRIGVFLALGVIFLVFSLIAIVALTGTFGAEDHRSDAQAVLAILLGRNQPRDTATLPGRRPGRRSGPPRRRRDQ